jgi:hypothetical protein
MVRLSMDWCDSELVVIETDNILYVTFSFFGQQSAHDIPGIGEITWSALIQGDRQI